MARMDDSVAKPSTDVAIQSIHIEPVYVDRSTFRTFDNETAVGIEEVSAALARIEQILRCLGYASTRIETSENPSTAVGRYSEEYQRLLLQLMQREPSLRRYLDAHSDPEESSANRAWAAASGDAIFIKTLREQGWKPASDRFSDLMKVALLPILLIILTALMGNWIATTLQRAALKHQKTFDVRLAGLQKGQERAAELYSEINDLYSTLSDAEDAGFRDLRTAKLRAQRQKMNSINASARLYDTNQDVGRSFRDAASLLDGFIQCLDEKRRLEELVAPGTPEACSPKFDLLPAFDNIVDAHRVALAQLVETEP
jgi:hypothetical protein